MAQEISEIYDEYWQELQTQSTLNDLNPQIDDQQTLLSDLSTPSKVAEHRLWIWDFSVFSWMQQLIFDRHKEEVVEIVAQNAYGHVKWWVEVMKQFQYGYALIFVNNRPGYQVSDANARIVTRAAAISQGGGNVLLKAAKEPTVGEPEALDPAELQALQEYCNMIAPAGPTIVTISLNADKLSIVADVKVDPLVINTVDGSLIADPSTFPVETAMNAYLANIPFDGSFSLTHLKDAVQLVEGVNDFIPITCTAYQGVNQTAITPVAPRYETVAGYIREHDTVGLTFSDTLTYIAGQ